jgi:polyisoprenoid-binding protein YceI
MNPQRHLSLSSQTTASKSLFGLALLVTALLAATSPVSAATYDIDTVHSSALFKVKHFDTAYFYGAFRTVSGTVQYDPSNPAASSIDVTIDAQSVDSRNTGRDDHLKSPDFLNAKQFPQITFKSKSVEARGDDLEVTGDLTMLGITREIQVTATKTGQGTNPRSKKDIIGFHSTFTVDRTAHDMNFMVGPLSQEISFILSLEAVKQ